MFLFAGLIESGLLQNDGATIICLTVKAKYRHMNVEQLQRVEKELRDDYKKKKDAATMQEIREVEALIRDKIWNKGGAQWKKERVQ